MAALDPIFGIHAEALAVQAKRMEVLSANIANADTPGYEARDIDFAKVLANAGKPPSPATASGPATTDPRHIAIGAANAFGNDGTRLPYRLALQPTVDHNSVDVQVEQAKFADAALHYQASLSFADGRVRSLLTAITGQ